MRSIILLLLLSLAVQAGKIVAYVPDWVYDFTWRNVDFTQVSHLDWAFEIPDAQGNLSALETQNVKRLDSLALMAHANGAGVLVSVGGADGSAAFPALVADAALRAKLCHNIKAFVQTHSLDGADIDWETPASSDTAHLVPFLRELRDTLGTGKLLTLAVPASDWGGKWFPIVRAEAAVDWLGVMTYDLTGSWDSWAEHEAALFPHGDTATWSVSQAMNYWATTRGFPKSKLLGGTPAYGFVFRSCPGPGKPFTGAVDALDESVIAQDLTDSGWIEHWDATSRVPWATTPGGGFVTWNNPRAAAEEGRWLASNGYGGTIVWEVTQDWRGGKVHPIFDSLAATILRGASSVDRSVSPGTGSRLRSNARDWSLEASWDESGEIRVLSLDGRTLARVAGRGRLVLDRPRSPGAVLVTWKSGNQHGFSFEPPANFAFKR